jgi:hypothetical protein
MMLAPNQQENLFMSYIRGKPDTVPYPELVRRVDYYRRHVAQRFISRREEDIPNLLGKRFIVSVKVDGGFAGFYFNAKRNESFFFNVPTHRAYLGLPVAQDLTKILTDKGIKEILLVGEMFALLRPSDEGLSRTTIQDLIKVRRNPQTQEDLEKIGYKVFDILQIDGIDLMEKDYGYRYEEMIHIFPQKGRASLVTSQIMESVYQIQDFYREQVLEKGHEGIIIRTGNTGYKIKPIHALDVVIIGIASGREDTQIREDQLASCLVAVRYPDGTYQILGRVGGGLTEQERSTLWNKFELADSDNFTYPTRDARVYTMVKPKFVAQIKYFDIKTEHDGNPILEPSLRYNSKTNMWHMVRQMPFVTLLSPTFIEGDPIRYDKSPEEIMDVRVKQILDLVDVPQVSKVTSPKMKSTEIIKKQMFQRGDVALKKFVVLKTNKESSKQYPAYILYFLDYSVGRKAPLDRKAKITNSDAQLWELYQDWINSELMGKNGALKRGWKEIL